MTRWGIQAIVPSSVSGSDFEKAVSVAKSILAGKGVSETQQDLTNEYPADEFCDEPYRLLTITGDGDE